jgi:hypothetical protein
MRLMPNGKVWKLNDGPFVCVRCVGDQDLKSWVRAHRSAGHCDYCGRSSASKPISAEVDELVAYVQDCLAEEYEDAANQVAFESREGGYQARTWSTYELLTEEVEMEPGHDELFEYLVHELPDYAWVERDYYSAHPYNVLRWGWEAFVETVKHRTRYMLFPRPAASPTGWEEHDEMIRPEKMLKAVGRVIRECRLVRTLPAGTLLYRVRPHDAGLVFSTITDLGPPPSDQCKNANRMSPAGLSMFYAAEDEATAVLETVEPAEKPGHYTMATFRLRAPVRVVDFVRLPPYPGIFTPGFTRESRVGRQFVHAFARDLGKPIARDGMEHVEYVPTQIVTEYLRYRFRSKGQPVVGIRYQSAKPGGGVNVALFAGHEDLIDSPWTTPSPVDLELAEARPGVVDALPHAGRES